MLTLLPNLDDILLQTSAKKNQFLLEEETGVSGDVICFCEVFPASNESHVGEEGLTVG
jgi:hypothetical protein